MDAKDGKALGTIHKCLGMPKEDMRATCVCVCLCVTINARARLRATTATQPQNMDTIKYKRPNNINHAFGSLDAAIALHC